MAGTRPAVLVDASVSIKWFVLETYSEQSIRLKDDHLSLENRIVVPALARYEVLNALKYSDGFGSRELIRAANDLYDCQLLEVSLDDGYGEAAARVSR